MPATFAVPLGERPVAGHQPCPDDDLSQAVLRSHALDAIRSMAANPYVAPSDVAAELGISELTLLRAFEHDPLTVADHLAQARLDLALAHLDSVRQRRLDDATVAARSGFASVANLERAMLMGTGMTLSDYRARAGESEPSAHRVRPTGAATSPAQRAHNLRLFLR